MTGLDQSEASITLFSPPGHHYYTINTIVIDIGVGIVGVIGININIIEIVVVIVDVVVDIHNECHNSRNEVDKVEGIRTSYRMEIELGKIDILTGGT